MKSFLAGKRTLDIAPLRPQPTATSLAGAAHCPAGPAVPSDVTPHIDIVKQGDKIVRIVVTCTCGERTEIECLYPPGQPPPA